MGESAVWEVVTDELNEQTERLAVAGGWLYRATLFDQGAPYDATRSDAVPVAVALCFVPCASPEPLPDDPEDDAPELDSAPEAGSGL